MIGLKISISSKKNVWKQDKDAFNKENEIEVSDDPRIKNMMYGDCVTALIPCIDPEKNTGKKVNPDEAKMRVLTEESIINMRNELNTENLASEYPLFYNFMPTPEMMKKLILRMVQIKPEKYQK